MKRKKLISYIQLKRRQIKKWPYKLRPKRSVISNLKSVFLHLLSLKHQLEGLKANRMERLCTCSVSRLKMDRYNDAQIVSLYLFSLRYKMNKTKQEGDPFEGFAKKESFPFPVRIKMNEKGLLKYKRLFCGLLCQVFVFCTKKMFCVLYYIIYGIIVICEQQMVQVIV